MLYKEAFTCCTFVINITFSNKINFDFDYTMKYIEREDNNFVFGNIIWFEIKF